MSEAAFISMPEEGSVDFVTAAACGRDDWDAYADASANGSFFHRYDWGEIVANVYGYENLSIAAMRDGVVVGLLPLTDVKAPLLGRSLVSTAFTVGGGPIADDSSVMAGLAKHAAELGRVRAVNYVELRSNPDLDESWAAKTDVYADFALPLPRSEEENLKIIPRKRRAEIRKAIKSAEAGELLVREVRDANSFYTLYAHGLRDHGTPVFPKRFLDAVVSAFSEETEILIAEWRGRPVAGLLSFYQSDRVMPYFIGAVPEARAARAAEFLYWTVMRHAAARGCSVFDFGRSKIGSGPWQFKKLWGAEPRPIAYRYKLVGAQTMPDVNPNNPKFSGLVSAWRHLPLPVANLIGPQIAANFP